MINKIKRIRENNLNHSKKLGQDLQLLTPSNLSPFLQKLCQWFAK